MTAWLRRGAAAAALAGERSDLWPAGTLAWIAYLGWLPLVLAVAPPDVAEVAGLAVDLYSSGSYPANVAALAVALVGAFMLLALLAAAGEVALTRALGAGNDDATSPSSSSLAGLSVLLLASAPALLALAWLIAALAAIGPVVYGAPGPEATVIPRLAAAVVPQLVTLALAVLLAQALGGVLLRRAILSPSERLVAALGQGLRDVRRTPARWLGVAAVGWVMDGLLLLLSWLLLRTLWAPIAESLGPGLLASPQLLLLLVGFVAIWLILLLAGGALHAFISAWRLFEEADGR